MSNESTLTDSEITKLMVGRWQCRPYVNQGMRWSYVSEFTADGRCTIQGTGENNGQTIPFNNAGQWWIEQQVLVYKIEESSIPALVGRETRDPLISIEPNSACWRNTAGHEAYLDRITE